jgi:predicted dehydrogenase/nucleoside-diphosphate-sugar epimerase
MTAVPPFRIVIIGTGEAAAVLHLPAALASDLIEVAALVDPVVERAKALALRYGVAPQIGSSLDDIEAKVDGAIIATPNDTHRDLAIDCARRGIHCLVEKPLATSVADAEQICRAATEHSVVLAVGYAMRFRNEVVLVKRLLETGYFGDIRRFHIQHGTLGGWSPASRFNLDKRASGGGVLINSGTHFLDLTLYWFGYPDACEMLDDASDGPEAHCIVTLSYCIGGRRFDGTMRLSKLFDLDAGIVIETDRGMLVLRGDLSSLSFRPRNAPQLQMTLEERGKLPFHRKASNFQLQLEDFVAASRGQRPPLVDGGQGLLSMRLLDQLYSCRRQLSELGARDAEQRTSRLRSPNMRTAEAMKVAVFGASGFVGSTLVERFQRKGIDVSPAIHSSGNAWRLARHGIPLRSVDVLSRADVAECLRGCTHVVNCTRGSDEVMIGGLKNLLAEAAKQQVRRFVHLSSIAVYGQRPPPEAKFEECVARPTPGSYGAIKLRQDQLVARAHANGLSCAILCPPDITGPYSAFLSGVLADMKSGSLALVDDGITPINLVDVENLCHAIELALCIESADGRRMFITDGEEIAWQDLTDELMALAELAAPLPSLPRAEVGDPIPARISVRQAIGHLVSSEVRSALRADPFFAKIEIAVRDLVKSLPGRFGDELSARLGGPIQVANVHTGPRFGSRYVSQQLRGVTHSCKRAARVLGYKPVVGFRESMNMFRRWYMSTRGIESESWPLARELL